jgi:hypothetical protein
VFFFIFVVYEEAHDPPLGFNKIWLCQERIPRSLVSLQHDFSTQPDQSRTRTFYVVCVELFDVCVCAEREEVKRSRRQPVFFVYVVPGDSSST